MKSRTNDEIEERHYSNGNGTAWDVKREDKHSQTVITDTSKAVAQHKDMEGKSVKKDKVPSLDRLNKGREEIEEQ